VAKALRAHTVIESRAREWHLLKNGDLLKAAEDAAFDVFVTSDKNIQYQQNLTNRKLAIVVLRFSRTRRESICRLAWPQSGELFAADGL
jgi:hypothetical protein